MTDIEKNDIKAEDVKGESPVAQDGALHRGMSTEMANQIDLNANISAKIRNPLLGIPRSELLADVKVRLPRRYS